MNLWILILLLLPVTSLADPPVPSDDCVDNTPDHHLCAGIDAVRNSIQAQNAAQFGSANSGEQPRITFFGSNDDCLVQTPPPPLGDNGFTCSQAHGAYFGFGIHIPLGGGSSASSGPSSGLSATTAGSR